MPVGESQEEARRGSAPGLSRIICLVIYWTLGNRGIDMNRGPVQLTPQSGERVWGSLQGSQPAVWGSREQCRGAVTQGVKDRQGSCRLKASELGVGARRGQWGAWWATCRLSGPTWGTPESAWLPVSQAISAHRGDHLGDLTKLTPRAQRGQRPPWEI